MSYRSEAPSACWESLKDKLNAAAADSVAAQIRKGGYSVLEMGGLIEGTVDFMDESVKQSQRIEEKLDKLLDELREMKRLVLKATE